MDLNSELISYIANVGLNDEHANEIARTVSIDINASNVKLIEIIFLLKDEFTSEVESSRQKSLNCLSNILSRLNYDLLTKNEVSVIFNFYESKFDELLLMTEVLDGFNSLINMKSITKQEIVKTLRLIKERYEPTKFLTATRYFSFKILENIKEKYSIEFNKDFDFSEIFIESFLHISNGEKDPRNLLMSFNLNKSISSSMESAKLHSEDLFDVLFCYFPITFKPPKNDPYNISTENLKIALRSVISSSTIYAEDAFSNLTDKLAATSPSVKNDTLQTLKLCIKNYGGELCLKEWLPLWSALKFELMHNAEGGEVGLSNPSEIQPLGQPNYQVSLDVIKELASALSEFDMSAFEKFFLHILDELKPNFKYNKDLKQSSKILSAISSANTNTFNRVISGTFPLFMNNTSEIPQLKLMIMNLSFFFDAYINVFGLVSIDEIKTQVTVNSLGSYKDEILMILSKALTGSSEVEVTLRTLAIIQFTKLVKMRGYLSKEEVALIVQYFSETILTDSNKNIYYACLEGLKVISLVYEDIVFEVALKKMLELLPEDSSKNIIWNNDKVVNKENILKVILDYSTSRHCLVKESIFGITEKLCAVSKQQNSNEYCFLLISTLYSLFENNMQLLTEDNSYIIKENIENKLVHSILNDSSILEDNHNLSLLSTVLYFVNIKCSRSKQKDELKKYNTTFIQKYNVLINSSRLIVPYVKLVSSLDKEIVFENCNEYLECCYQIIKMNSKTMSEFEKLGYLELLMVLSNKWIQEETISKYYKWNDLTIENLEILTWFTKGLLMKNAKSSTYYLKKFIELLGDKGVGSFVSKLFEIFVIDITSFQITRGIPWSNNIKQLYKQKFFGDIFNNLVTEYKQKSDILIKSNYLTALSLILKHTPETLIEPFMKELLPLLLQALDMPNAEVKISSLETLRNTSEKNTPLTTEYFHTIVPMLLDLLKKDTSNSVRVRLLSLELLQMLAIIVPLNYCLPVKNEVLSTLIPTLDDKKRLVRKQCVDTRQTYFELGRVYTE